MVEISVSFWDPIKRVDHMLVLGNILRMEFDVLPFLNHPGFLPNSFREMKKKSTVNRLGVSSLKGTLENKPGCNAEQTLEDRKSVV